MTTPVLKRAIAVRDTAPASSSEGDIYIVGPTPGNWDGQSRAAHQWAVKLSSSWQFTTPSNQDVAIVDTGYWRTYDSGVSAWDDHTGLRVEISYDVTVEDDLTVQSQWTLQVLGGTIDVQGQKSLTIEGPFVAPSKKVFTGDALGNVSINDPTLTPRIHAAWWGVDPLETAANNAEWLNVCIVSLATGSVLQLPIGTIQLSDAGLDDTSGLAIPQDDITIVGWGEHHTTLQIDGTTYAVDLFVATNRRGLTLRGLHMKGNNQESASPLVGHALIVKLTSAASGSLEDYVIERCRFEDFAAPGWITFDSDKDDARLLRIRISDCLFSGGSNPSSGYASCILMDGHDTAGDDADGIAHVKIQSNYFECNKVKSALVAANGVRDLMIAANRILDAGKDITSVTEAYAIRLDINTGRAIVTSNLIKDPEQAGLYAKSCTDLVVKGNVITGQKETGSGIVGGVALDAVDRFVVSENDLHDCHFGVQVLSEKGGACNGNSIFIKSATGAIGIKIRSDLGTGKNAKNIVVTGNSIVHEDFAGGAKGTGIYLTRPSSGAENAYNICLADNTLDNLDKGISIEGGSHTARYHNSRISSNVVRTATGTTKSSYGITIDYGLEDSVISSNLVAGEYSSGGVAIEVKNCNGIYPHGNKVCGANGTDNTAYDFTGSEGSLWGNQSRDVTTVAASGGLGVDTPTFTSEIEDGTVIQRLAPGSGDTKIGWVHKGGSWKEWGAIS